MSKLSIKKKAKLARIAFSTPGILQRGDQVKWLGVQSENIYVVKDLEGNMVYLINDEGNEIEALDYEVVKV